MTNTQLLLSIGTPSLLILLSWVTNNTRFDRIEERLDKHDWKFDWMRDAAHLDALESMRSMTA